MLTVTTQIILKVLNTLITLQSYGIYLYESA